jgi:hypothetical protein
MIKETSAEIQTEIKTGNRRKLLRIYASKNVARDRPLDYFYELDLEFVYEKDKKNIPYTFFTHPPSNMGWSHSMQESGCAVSVFVTLPICLYANLVYFLVNSEKYAQIDYFYELYSLWCLKYYFQIEFRDFFRYSLLN